MLVGRRLSPFWATVRYIALCYGNVVLSFLLATLVYCGEKVAWIRMLLRARVGLGPDDIV